MNLSSFLPTAWLDGCFFSGDTRPEQQYNPESLKSHVKDLCNKRDFESLANLCQEISRESLGTEFENIDIKTIARAELSCSPLQTVSNKTSSRAAWIFENLKKIVLISVAGRITFFVYSFFSFDTVDHISLSAHALLKSVESTKYFFSDFWSMHTSLHNYMGHRWAYPIEIAIGLIVLQLCLLYDRLNIGRLSQLERGIYVDLTRKARAGEIAPCIGRESILNELATQLSFTPLGKGVSVFLVGEPGVGKTHIVEGLACRIADGQVLPGKSIISTNASKLLRSSKNSLKAFTKLLDTLKGKEEQIIVFIDEAHTLGEGGNNLLQTLKTELSSRNIFAIFATTADEYKKYIASDKAFVERCRIVEVPPLDKASTQILLLTQANQYGIPIDPEAVQEIVAHNEKFSECAEPRKSVKILEDIMKAFENASSDCTTVEASDEQTSQLTLEFITNSRNPNWIIGEAGQQFIQKLQAADQEKEKIQKAREEKSESDGDLSECRTAFRKFQHKKNQLARQIASSSTTLQSKEVEFLLIRNCILPQLRKQLESFPTPTFITQAYVKGYLAKTTGGAQKS